jgi:hypothetical protein
MPKFARKTNKFVRNASVNASKCAECEQILRSFVYPKPCLSFSRSIVSDVDDDNKCLLCCTALLPKNMGYCFEKEY